VKDHRAPVMGADHEASPLDTAAAMHPAVDKTSLPSDSPLDGAAKARGDTVVSVPAKGRGDEQDLDTQPEEKAKLSDFWVCISRDTIVAFKFDIRHVPCMPHCIYHE
jgi:hypothetical protein